MDTGNALVAGASRTTQQAVNIGQVFSSDVTLGTTFPTRRSATSCCRSPR